MNDWLSKQLAIRSKPKRLVAGVLSGTSMDGIDVAICSISEKIELVRLYSSSYPEALHARLAALTQSRLSQTTLSEVAELNVLVAEAFAAAVSQALAESSISQSQLDLVGSHGQTVYHHSRRPGAFQATLQLGDGDVIAERLNVTVISDFRARDIAAGGEGAPLSPYADAVLYGLSKQARVILNLGGMANITVLSDSADKTIGFDTGPANAPLDRLVIRLTNGRDKYDADGVHARAGVVQTALLERLLNEDTFTKLAPPRSCGFEIYGDDFVDRVVDLYGGVDSNLISTITEFVARTIADAIKQHVLPNFDISTVIVAGGGAYNSFLLERLRELLSNCSVELSDAYGVPAQAREAMAFAVLANDALLGKYTSIPAVTGAKGARVLGKICLAR